MAAAKPRGKRFSCSSFPVDSVFAPSVMASIQRMSRPSGLAGTMIMATRSKPGLKIQDTTLRHLWLAGLGVAESARRASLVVASEASEKLDSLKKRAGLVAAETQASVLDGITSVREQGSTRASQFSADVEARLVPVLVKLGLKPARAPRARNSQVKSSAKRTPAASRKPVAKRKAGNARR